MSIDQLFFQLLQVAIGNKKSLDRMPSSDEWVALFDMAKKQALTAIAFTGVTKLNPGSDFGASLGMDEVTYLKWLGLTAKVAQRNKELNAECAKVCAELAHDGLQCCVLKGQSNLVNYPEDLRECRTPGDIDLWTLPHQEETPSVPLLRGKNRPDGKSPYAGRFRGSRIAGVVEYAQQWRRIRGQKPITKDRVLYYHVEMDTDSGIEVELHYRPSFLCSPLRNHRLQNWFHDNEQFNLCDAEFAQEATGVFRGLTECQSGPTKGSKSPLATVEGTPLCKKSVGELVESIPIPTVSFNAVYQLLHIYKHLFEEGIGLRQLLDYYFVLRALHIEQGDLADRGATKFAQKGQTLLCKNERQSIGQWAVLRQAQKPEKDTVGERSRIQGIAVASNKETVGEPVESIMHTLSRFGMKKFASATMWVLQKVFAMPDENLLCQPNEKEGKFLLNEIMQAGNFGKYDDRIKRETPSIPLLRGKKVPQQLWHAWEKLKHNFRLIRHYPEEVLWEPFFRLYHYLWRKFRLWRF